MSERRVRVLPIAMMKFSPLAALVFAAIIFGSLPLPLIGVLFTAPEVVAYGIPRADLESLIDGLDRAKTAETAGLIGDGDSFQAALQETWELVAERTDALVADGSVQPVPFDAGDGVFEPVAEWERTHGVRVWAWTVLAPEMPPVFASAKGRPGVTIEPGVSYTATGEPMEPDPDADLATLLWRELHEDGSALPALESGIFSRGSSVGIGNDKDQRLALTVTAGDTAWRCIVVGDTQREDLFIEQPPGIDSKDPRKAGYDEWLSGLADEHGLDIWVYGPLDSAAVPLRVPEGGTEQTAEAIADRIWPGMFVADGGGYSYVAPPTAMDAETARLAGGPAASLVTMDLSLSDTALYYNPSPDSPAPQTIAALVVFDEVPGGAPGPLAGIWRAWRLLLASNLGLAAGAVFALLAVSLVASPAAFVIDRRRRIKERAAEEVERMRCDAHDKVYNRLSALSKRVAEVGDAATNGTAGSLTAIAEDIRYTVGELQQILGSDVEHTSSALADVPVADQLAAVCGAQAARLGVAVACDVAPDIPVVSPRLGWDLQCITEEAITNAVRHGGASEVRVSMRVRAPDTLVLVVTDDGCGSCVHEPDEATEGSTGLRGMRDRTARHGGLMDIHADAQGTTVAVAIPFASGCGVSAEIKEETTEV